MYDMIVTLVCLMMILQQNRNITNSLSSCFNPYPGFQDANLRIMFYSLYKCSFSYFLLFYTTKYAISCTLCSVMSHVVLFAYRIILNILTRNTVTKILEKKLYFEFK